MVEDDTSLYMSLIETVQYEPKVITPEVVFPPISKYAFNVLIPHALSKETPTTILVWAHGSLLGKDYNDIIGQSRRELSYFGKSFNELNAIVLMPVLPRWDGNKETPPQDSQMMGRHVMMHNWNDFYHRPDEELLKVIALLQERFTSARYSVRDKILIGGVSSGATFANRFAFLYPDLVGAIALPLAGDFIYPESELGGVTLPYPFGIKDIQQIERNRMNNQIFSMIPTFLYGGMLDIQPMNNPLHYETIGLPHDLEEKLKSLFGQTQFERFLHYAEYLIANKTPVVVESSIMVGHQMDVGIMDKIAAFFAKNTK